MTRLFYMPRTRSNRVLWTLGEIGAPFDSTRLAPEERRGTEHRTRHPLGRVPALELDDGTMMFESAAICLQLADLHPDAGLIPSMGSSGRALVYQWVLFGMTELESSLYRWLSEMRDGETDSPSERRFSEAADAIAGALSDKTWLVDERFTVADVVCVGVLGSAATRELLSPWGVLGDYVDRGEARPAYQAAVQYGVAATP